MWNQGFPETSGSLSSSPIRDNFGFLKTGLDVHASSSFNPHATTLDQVAIANPVTGQQITVKGLNNIRFADQFASIQAAINDLPAGGGVVYIPSGSYNLSSTILLRDDISLIGEGAGITVLQLVSGSNCDVLGAVGTISNVQIANLTIDGNKDNQGDESVYNIFGIIVSGSRIVIENVEVKDCKEQGILLMGDDVRIENCRVTNCKWNDITLEGNRNIVNSTFCSGSLDCGIEITAISSGSTVSNCLVSDCSFGIFINTNKGSSVIGCNISGCADKGILLIARSGNCENNLIDGNIIYDCHTGILVEPENSYVIQNITLSNNNINYCDRIGISLVNANFNIISNNLVMNCGRNYGSNAAIYLQDSSYNHIVGNKCFDNQGVKVQNYGLLENGTSDYNKILSNDFNDNLIDNTNIIGTHTYVFDVRNDRFEFSKDLYVDGNISGSVIAGSELRSNSDVYVNYGGPEATSYIYFYNGGSSTGAYIRWREEGLNRFEFDGGPLYVNNDLDLSGNIKTDHGDIFIRNAGSAYEDEGYLYFCNGVKQGSIKFSYNPNHRFELDHGLYVNGNISGSADLYLIGKATAVNGFVRNKYINLPIAGAILPDGSVGNLAAAIERQSASGAAPNPHYMVARFDDTQEEFIQFSFSMPEDYVAGTLEAVIQYKMISATSGNVDFDVAVAAITPGDAQDMDTKAFSTLNSGVSTVPATAGYVKELRITLTNNDSLAAGDMVVIFLKRDADDGTDDTATGDCEVVSIKLKYSAQ